MKLTRISFTSLALTTLLLGGFVLLAPEQELDAGQCLPCSLGSPTTTAPVTKVTQDCQWSVMEAKAALSSQANCDSYCVKQFITTDACHETYPYSNQWTVTMKLKYQCEECLDEQEL